MPFSSFSDGVLWKMQHCLPSSPKILLALSGGADSLFLGEIFSSLLSQEKIVVAHFDHNLRQNSSDDASFCEQWAKEKNLLFFQGRWKDPKKSEEKARKARYEFLENIRHQEMCDAIAVASHADDQVETIFFQMLRGTGAKGLSGMSVFSSSRKIFRPLLSVSKKEILSALAQEDISFCTDETNAESVYSRNFLRNDIFPLLQGRFPSFSSNILRQADIFRQEQDFLRMLLSEFSQKSIVEKTDPFWEMRITLSDFQKQHRFLQSSLIQSFFSQKSISYEQTQEVLSFLREAPEGKKKEVRNLSLLIGGGYCYLREKEVGHSLFREQSPQ